MKHEAVSLSIYHSEKSSPYFRLHNIREKSIHMTYVAYLNLKYFFPMNTGVSSFYLDFCLSTQGRFFQWYDFAWMMDY